MKDLTAKLINTTLLTLSAGLLATTTPAFAKNSNPWQSLSLGSCFVQFSTQQAFLYCKGAPNKTSVAVLDTSILNYKQMNKLQCHTSLNARQINCFTANIKQAIALKHIALVNEVSRCQTVKWTNDKYGQYQLAALNCQFGQSNTYISLTDFKALTSQLENPTIVSYNGQLVIDSAYEEDFIYTSDTSMGDDDPSAQFVIQTDTSMGDDDPSAQFVIQTDTSMGDDDPNAQFVIQTDTSMGDDDPSAQFVIQTDTSMGDDDPSAQFVIQTDTSMGDDDPSAQFVIQTDTSMGDDDPSAHFVIQTDTSMGDDDPNAQFAIQTDTSMGDDDPTP